MLVKQVEEVVPVYQPGHAFLDDAEERVQGLEVVEVGDRCHRPLWTVQAAAVRQAKSAKSAKSAKLVGPRRLPSPRRW